MSGNPCSLRFLTGGEKSSLPLNHGLTVCWTVETTSRVWPGISERMWPETISHASCCSDEGRVSVTVNSSARQTAAAPDIALVSQFQFQPQACCCASVLAGDGNSDLIRCRNSSGAVK